MLLLASVTVHVTRVTPFGKTAGASLVTLATLQLSAVTGVPRLTPLAVQRPASATTVRFAGHMMVGGMVSLTVMTAVQLGDPIAAARVRELSYLDSDGFAADLAAQGVRLARAGQAETAPR